MQTPSPKRRRCTSPRIGSPAGRKRPSQFVQIALEPFTVISRSAPGARGKRVVRKCHTTEEPEFEELLRMNKRFIRDCHSGGELITSAATCRTKDVQFIVADGEK